MLIISCCSLSEAKTLYSLQNTLSVTKCDIAKRILRTSIWEKADVFRRIKSPRSWIYKEIAGNWRRRKGKKTQHKWKCLKIRFLVSLDDSMGAWLWCPVLGPWCGCMLPAPFAIGRQGIMCHASGHTERREGCSWAPIPITSPFQPCSIAA